MGNPVSAKSALDIARTATNEAAIQTPVMLATWDRGLGLLTVILINSVVWRWYAAGYVVPSGRTSVAVTAAGGGVWVQDRLTPPPVPTNSILMPLYIYPSDIFNNVVYNALIDTIKATRGVPFYIILNNSNGPGAAQDANFTYAIRRLHGAGALILGYVDSGNLVTKTDAQIRTDMDTWMSFYPEVDGYFLDQMSNVNDTSLAARYAALTAYAHGKGVFPVVANPGAPQLGIYFTAKSADVIVTYENVNVYPTEAALKGDADLTTGYNNFPTNQRGVLIYGMTDAVFSAASNALLKKYTGMIYVTDGTGANPWGVVSKYLPQLITLIGGSATPTFATITGSDFNILVTGTTVLTAAPALATGAVITISGGDVYATITGTAPTTASPPYADTTQIQIAPLVDAQAFRAIIKTGAPHLIGYWLKAGS